MLNDRGHEVLDNTPVEVPLGWTRPETLQETVRRLIRGAMSEQAVSQGAESFEEADDFEIGDDYDPSSPWELSADQENAREERRESWEEEAAKAGWKRPGAKSWQARAEEAGWQRPAKPARDAVDDDRRGRSSVGGDVPIEQRE